MPRTFKRTTRLEAAGTEGLPSLQSLGRTGLLENLAPPEAPIVSVLPVLHGHGRSVEVGACVRGGGSGARILGFR